MLLESRISMQSDGKLDNGNTKPGKNRNKID